MLKKNLHNILRELHNVRSSHVGCSALIPLCPAVQHELFDKIPCNCGKNAIEKSSICSMMSIFPIVRHIVEKSWKLNSHWPDVSHTKLRYPRHVDLIDIGDSQRVFLR